MTSTTNGTFLPDGPGIVGPGSLIDSHSMRPLRPDLDSHVRRPPGLGSTPIDGTSIDGAAIEGIIDSSPLAIFLGGEYPLTAWAPEYRVQLAVNQFARLDWQQFDPGAPDDNEAALAAELGTLRDLRAMRSERAAEILDQAGSFFPMFQHLLTSDGTAKPNTSALIQAGIQVGHMVVMHWKAIYKRLRPSTRYPALLPLIRAPGHPSYPSGHALQSHLAALLVTQAADAALQPAMLAMTTALAGRIGDNREVAGLHFPSDSEAGRKVAAEIAPLLITVPAIAEIIAAARLEWASARPGPPPDAAL